MIELLIVNQKSVKELNKAQDFGLHVLTLLNYKILAILGVVVLLLVANYFSFLSKFLVITIIYYL